MACQLRQPPALASVRGSSSKTVLRICTFFLLSLVTIAPILAANVETKIPRIGFLDLGMVRGEPEHGFERDVPVEAPIVRMRGQPLAITKTGALADLYPQRLRGQTHLAGRRRGSADHDVAGQQTRKPNGDADAEPSRIGDGLFLIERPQGAADHKLGAVERAVLHLG